MTPVEIRGVKVVARDATKFYKNCHRRAALCALKISKMNFHRIARHAGRAPVGSDSFLFARPRSAIRSLGRRGCGAMQRELGQGAVLLLRFLAPLLIRAEDPTRLMITPADG